MKRESSGGLTKSEDKKARLEAGLDLVGVKDITELQVENILKEVSAPSAICDSLDKWKTDFLKFISEIEFGKTKKEKLSSTPAVYEALPDGYKFDGAKVCSVLPGCRLAGQSGYSLVFPNAAGSITLYVRTNKPLQEAEDKRLAVVVMSHKLSAKLSNCSLVAELESGRWDSETSVWIRPNVNKLKNQLKIKIDLCFENESESGVSKSLQEELNRLLCNQNYRQAEQLLQIWTRQLKLWLPENLLLLVMLHLHLTNQLNVGMKAWSVVRRVWSYLSDNTLQDNKQILGLQNPVPDSGLTSPILDRDGARLLHPQLPAPQWQSLCSFAGAALTSQLKENFLVKHSAGAIYDKLYEVTGPGLSVCQLVLDLKYGLGNRVLRITCLDTHTSQDGVVIGLSLSPTAYYAPATHGPTSDDPEAEKFRSFWGERSELRRFHDGVVRETVVWGDKKNSIVGDIVRAVLGRHHHRLQASEQDVDCEQALLHGDGGESARREVDALVPVLYALEGLALAVSGVSCFGEEWRLARVGSRPTGWKTGKKLVNQEKGLCHLVDKGNMAPPWVSAVEVMLQAQHSGKWPKDEEARRRLKVAWLAEVGSALENKMEGLKQKILGENLVVVTPTKEVVIRFHVGEVKKGVMGNLCELSSWLGSLAVGNSAWSTGVRLAKRWVSSHLLADIVPDTAIELIMARVFLNPGQFGSAPVSGMSALHRWLQLVSCHDWNEAPLVVAPDMTFTESRSTLPPLAVISPKDPSPGYWSSPGPTWTELNRLVNLAAASLLILQSAKGDDEVRKAFTPALDSYEFLIELKPLQVPNRYLSIDRKNKEGTDELSEWEKSFSIPVLEYSPAVQLVQELNQSFSNIGKFYYDKYGGTVIGVKINKDVNKRVKISQIAGHISRGRETEVNWGAVVEDWEILGEGIIKSVNCQDSSIFC